VSVARYGQHPDKNTRLREQATVRRICALAAQGFPPGTITSMLNSQGGLTLRFGGRRDAPTRNGKPWARSTVLKIVTDNPRIVKRERAKIAAEKAERQKEAEYAAWLAEWASGIETPAWLKPYEKSLGPVERAAAIWDGHLTWEVGQWDSDTGTVTHSPLVVASQGESEENGGRDHVRFPHDSTKYKWPD